MTQNKLIALTCPLAFLIFGVYIRVSTLKMRASDATFPNIVAYIIIAVSLIQIVSDLKKDHTKNRFEQVNFAKIGLCISIMCIYVFLFKKIGFYLDTLWLTASTMYILNYKNFKGIVISSVIITTVVFVVFKVLLKVPLPTL